MGLYPAVLWDVNKGKNCCSNCVHWPPLQVCHDPENTVHTHAAASWSPCQAQSPVLMLALSVASGMLMGAVPFVAWMVVKRPERVLPLKAEEDPVYWQHMWWSLLKPAETMSAEHSGVTSKMMACFMNRSYPRSGYVSYCITTWYHHYKYLLFYGQEQVTLPPSD